MWSLIVGSLPPLSWNGILPAGSPVTLQNAMPYLFGIGFTSIGLEVRAIAETSFANCLLLCILHSLLSALS